MFRTGATAAKVPVEPELDHRRSAAGPAVVPRAGVGVQTSLTVVATFETPWSPAAGAGHLWLPAGRDAHPRYPDAVKMLSAGLVGGRTRSKGFVAAAEPAEGRGAPTGAVAFANRLFELLRDAGAGRRPLPPSAITVTVVVEDGSGTSVDQLVRGTLRGQAMTRLIDECATLHMAAGARVDHVIGALALGRADVNDAGFARYRATRRDFMLRHGTERLLATRNRDAGVSWFVDQPALAGDNYRNPAVEAINRAALADRGWVLQGADYHLSASAAMSGAAASLPRIWAAETFARIAHDRLFGAGARPFQPARAEFVGPRTIRYIVPVPRPPLVRNPHGYVDPQGLADGWGHEVIDPYRGTTVPITSVEIVDAAAGEVHIELASTTFGGVWLAYAMRPQPTSRGDVSARGELFDSDPAYSDWGNDGQPDNGRGSNRRYLNRPMDRWILHVPREAGARSRSRP